VALRAAGARRVKQRHAAFRGVRQRRLVIIEDIAIEGRAPRNQAALECGNRLDDVIHGQRRRIARKRRGEHLPIRRVAGQLERGR
jgi:hypothetical protein